MSISHNLILLLAVGALLTLAISEKRRRQNEGRELVRFVCTAILKLISERGPLTLDELRQALQAPWCETCRENLDRCLTLLDQWQMLCTFKGEDSNVWPLDLTPRAREQLGMKEAHANFVPADTVDTSRLDHSRLHRCTFE